MSLGTDEACSGEVVAAAPGDIEVIVYGESFPAKKLKKDIGIKSRNDLPCVPNSGCDGCVEMGDWMTEDQRLELQKLMSFPKENSATVFQIIVNVHPFFRLICERPHLGAEDKNRYYFTQLADLDR